MCFLYIVLIIEIKQSARSPFSKNNSYNNNDKQKVAIILRGNTAHGFFQPHYIVRMINGHSDDSFYTFFLIVIRKNRKLIIQIDYRLWRVQTKRGVNNALLHNILQRNAAGIYAFQFCIFFIIANKLRTSWELGCHALYKSQDIPNILNNETVNHKQCHEPPEHNCFRDLIDFTQYSNCTETRA